MDLWYHRDEQFYLILKDAADRNGFDLDSLPFQKKNEFMIKAVKGCKRCPLYAYQGVPMFPRLNQSPIYFLGRNPGEHDRVNDTWFSTEGFTGKVFDSYLRTLDVTRSQVSISGCVLCGTKKNTPPLTAEYAACRVWKTFEFLTIPFPRVIFALGDDSLRLFMGPNFPTVTSVYGKIFKVDNTVIIPTCHPTFILRNEEWRKDTEELLKSMKEVVHAALKE